MLSLLSFGYCTSKFPFECWESVLPGINSVNMIGCLMDMSNLMLINHPGNKADIYKPAACSIVAFVENQKIALHKKVLSRWTEQ